MERSSVIFIKTVFLMKVYSLVGISIRDMITSFFKFAI